MAHRSRYKGIRGEHLIRDILRKLGYKADRVPQIGFGSMQKGNDVIAEKDGRQYTFEVKWRATSFDSIFHWYEVNHRGEHIIRAKYEDKLISISSDFELVRKPDGLFLPMGEDSNKVLRKFLRMQKEWLGKADFLALKGDRVRPIFIKFWG